MSDNLDIQKVFLDAVHLTNEKRSEYWIDSQKKSDLSKLDFLKELLDLCKQYESDISYKIQQRKQELRNRFAQIEKKVPEHQIDDMSSLSFPYNYKSQFSNIGLAEIIDLYKSIEELFHKWDLNTKKRKKFPFEKRRDFWEKWDFKGSIINLINDGIIDTWIHEHCKKEMSIKWHLDHPNLEPQLCFERLDALKSTLKELLSDNSLSEVHKIIKMGILEVESEIEYLKENDFNINFDARIFDVERTNPVLKKSTKETFDKNIEPIHWYDNDLESLKKFIETLKVTNFIESRETNDIILEHFYVNGQKPTKEPKPIKWLLDNQYLAYFFHRIIEEMFITVKDKKHELVASHFISNEGKKLNPKSLATQLSKILNHEKSNNIYIQKIETFIQSVKS